MNIVVLLLILILIGALPVHPYSANWGYAPAGGLSLIVVVLIVLLLLGHL